MIVVYLAIGAALTIGCATWLIRVRLARRRRRLNEVLHELRRPLQRLALDQQSSGLRSGWLAQAVRALADLDSIVNARPCPARAAAFSLSELIGGGRHRWPPDAVRFRVERCDARLVGDPVEIAAALDNLIANAVEHGTGPVTVCAGGSNGSAVLSVSSAPGAVGADRSRADPRRGHGLRIAERVARKHRGALARPRLIGGAMTARLILPVGAVPEEAEDR